MSAMAFAFAKLIMLYRQIPRWSTGQTFLRYSPPEDSPFLP